MKPAKALYIQVLIAIALGVALGAWSPDWGVLMEPLGSAFIKAIKMLIAPIIFTTVATGIAGMGNVEKIGRVGWKSLLYFEVVTTLALVIGMLVAHAIQPGHGIHADVKTLDASSLTQYTKAAEETGTVKFLLNIIPDTFVSAFVKGEILQVLLIAVLAGIVLAKMGEPCAVFKSARAGGGARSRRPRPS